MVCETLTLGSFGGPFQGSQEATEQGWELSQWHLEKWHSEKAIGVSWPVSLRTGDRELGYQVPSAIPKPWVTATGQHLEPSLPSLRRPCPPPGGLSSLPEGRPSMEAWPLFLLGQRGLCPLCPFSHLVPGT
ncbi:hypothetical protein HJG60_009557 [Phyllostomus discolor]|uniref:Uncharacterized protein n=1 Tax=Phyllostomus discolor TaxID=89673 RepID=A0A833YGQ0_9CHIR|nr:hypothetical protein HJG60_009557 [Phyllostomus discolor]